MTLKDFVLKQVNPNDYYESRFPEWNRKYKFNVLCPWHEKEGGNKPSFAIGLNNGGAHCHGCDCNKSFGNIIHFESAFKQIEEAVAAKNLYAEFIRPIIPEEKIKRWIANLQFSPQIIEKTCKDLGVCPNLLSSFRIGWDCASFRLIIPLPSRFGFVTNVRYYRLPSDRSNKDKAPKIYNETGYGHLELYPWKAIKQYDPDIPLIWMKAERDTLLGIQMGFQCFCITGSGESAKLDQWINEFKDYSIYICGDNDAQGKSAASNRFDSINGHCKFAKQIFVPKGKDFSEWVLEHKGTKEKFQRLLHKKSSEILPSVGHSKNGTGKSFFHLSELKAGSCLVRDTTIKTKGIIIGKLDRNYNIPYKFKLTYKNSTTKLYELPISRELLWLIRSNDEAIEEFVREKVLKEKGIRRIVPTEFLTATEVEIAPLVDLTSTGTHVTYNAVYVGQNLETNVPYELEIIPTSSIKTQEQIGIIVKATPTSAALDVYIQKQSTLKTLNIFRADDLKDSYGTLCNFANEIAFQYTRIYNRLDWHICSLLTYFSPLYFNFPYEPQQQRGWINTIGLGDTQTGKSQTAHSLQKIFACGTIVDGENCTFVGLVGGTIKNSTGQFMLRWGRIPVNDRQLVIVEELSGLSTAEISRMSDVRSSGIARIDKGGITAETTARTRLLVLSNVRGSGKALASYKSGLTALSELVGQAEDVSRFDLICLLTDSDVDAKTINQIGTSSEGIGMYSEEDLQNLVRFIWCLKPEQINFTQEAYEASLQICKDMAKVYHPSVPIFKAGSGRLKLARIACAVACSQFNWHNDRIEVTEHHVKCAQKILEMGYDKPILGYKSYSEKQYKRDNIQHTDQLDAVFEKVFKKEDKRNRIVKYLEMNGRFSNSELTSIVSIDSMSVARFVGQLVDSNIVERSGPFWQVTQAGKKWVLDKLKTS